MAETIFSKILSGEIPAEIIHEDDLCIAFLDIAPEAPVHFLVIPRTPFEDAVAADAATLGHVFQVASRLGHERCPAGFRLVTNIGPDGGQTVQHLHVHVLGGRHLEWPPG